MDEFLDIDGEIEQSISYAGPIAMESAPAPTPKFTTDIIERVMACVMWPVAYIYSIYFTYSSSLERRISFGIFIVLFVVMAEIFYFKRKRTVENWIFLTLAAITTVTSVFGIGRVWDIDAKMFFTHLFVVYWVLSRSNRLAEGETSHMFLWDGISGFFVMTFKNMHLNIGSIITIFSGRKKTAGKKKNVWGAIIGSVIGIILLCIAVGMLKNADENFKNLMNTISDFFKIKWEFDVIVRQVGRFMVTLFVANYLYGLLGGCYRESSEQVAQRGNNIKDFIVRLRKIPAIVWVILIGMFSIFYLLFFGLQGSYLFDAFSMTLPTQYTFSEYARKGFGDMCGVMIVNFIVTWLTMRTSVIDDKGGMGKAVKIASAVLTVESIFFAVIAMLKLLMYIDAYGFTPLRLQSVWLVVVLTFACICILISMFSGKKTAKYWFIGSAATLAVLCIF